MNIIDGVTVYGSVEVTGRSRISNSIFITPGVKPVSFRDVLHVLVAWVRRRPLSISADSRPAITLTDAQDSIVMGNVIHGGDTGIRVEVSDDDRDYIEEKTAGGNCCEEEDDE